MNHKIKTKKEKIILSNKLNTSQVLKSLARNGVDTFGMRIFSSLNLALWCLENSFIFYEGELISDNRRIAIIKSILEDNDYNYFKFHKLEDAKNILSSIDDMRLLYIEENEDKIRENLFYDSIVSTKKMKVF